MYKPLLNVSTTAYAVMSNVVSALTRSKISATLVGRKDSDATRARKSAAQQGVKHRLYGKPLPLAMLDKAAELKGTKVYVYDITTFSLINGKPFRSIRSAAKQMPISPMKLTSILNSNVSFKGYYYYTSHKDTRP